MVKMRHIIYINFVQEEGARLYDESVIYAIEYIDSRVTCMNINEFYVEEFRINNFEMIGGKISQWPPTSTNELSVHASSPFGVILRVFLFLIK